VIGERADSGRVGQALSLSTIITGRSGAAAMLFSASQAIPPVSAPSPTTATMCRRGRRQLSSRALAMPSAQDSAVEACEFSITPCSDSTRHG